MPVRGSVAGRFWSKVDKSGDCWLWTAFVHPLGYGLFKLDGRMQRAHRVSYEIVKGPIPQGLVLDHLCRVKHCVNPDHLEAVTQQVNINRGDLPEVLRQKQLRKTHCPQGHPYDEVNTYYKKGRGDTLTRQCRECHNSRRRKNAKG